MATNIESRLERLEAKLVLSNPQERMVLFLIWTSSTSTKPLVDNYSDKKNGHTLRREPDESPESFQDRATAWVRFEHRHDAPECACVLSGSDRRVTAAL